MIVPGRLAVILAALLLLQIDGRTQQSSVTPPHAASVLHPGVEVNGILDAANEARYEIAVREGDALEVQVTQPDLDLQLRLLDPAGQELAWANLRREPQGAERLIVVMASTGTVVLSVERGDRAPRTAARYSLTSTLRASTEDDRQWSDAAGAFLRGIASAEQRTRDSLQASLPFFDEARTAWSRLGAQFETATVLDQIGIVQTLLSQLQDARVALEAGAALRRTIGDRYGEGGALNSLGAVHARLGEYAKAAEIYERSVAARREVGDAVGLGYSLIGLAGTRVRVTDGWSSVVDVYQEALALFEQTADLRGQAEALYNLGYGYKQLNAFDRAVGYFDRALAIRRELKDQAGQAIVLNQVATIELQLGDPERALEILEDALPLRRSSGDRRGEGYTLQMMGVALTQAGRLPAASERLTAALQIFEAVGDRDGRTSALMHTARLRAVMGEHAAALELATRAQHLAGQELTLTTPILWSVIGDAHLAMGANEAAAEAYASGLKDAQRLREELPAARALAGLGRIARASGDLDASRRHLDDALARIESVRATVPQSELRASFLALTQPTYEQAVETSIALHEQHPSAGYAAEALAISERRRARALLELLARAEADVRSRGDATLVAKEEEIQRRLNARAAERGRVPTRPQEAGGVEIDREISDLVAELRDVREALRTQSPRYAAVAHPVPLDLPRIQQLLDEHTVLLEYSLGETRSHLWAITPTTMTWHALPGRSTIETSVQRARDLIADSARRGVRGPLQRALEEVSAMLLGDVADRLANKRLAIVADGVLQFLPFGVLPSPTYASRSVPLVVDHEIVMLPSASALHELRQNTTTPRASQTVAVLADPVFQDDDPRLAPVPPAPGASAPAQVHDGTRRSTRTITRAADSAGRAHFERLLYTRAEALAIAAKAPDRSLTAMGFEASRELALSPAMGDYRIVHFATHTVLDARHPELSGIVLTLLDRGRAPIDGFLRLHDIFNLQLSAEVVVLSACETALGAEVRGEGLVGLTRGFMYAGASQIVASLWNVNDRATAVLMDAFYDGLLERKLTPAAALRAAQIALMKNPRWQMPVYWAGFTVQGDWRPPR